MNNTSLDSIASAVGVVAVIALGLSAGAMLAEAELLVPYWQSLPPELFLKWYKSNAALLLNFYGPLEIASAVIAIMAAALHQYRHRAGRGLFVAAAVLVVILLAMFPLYFQDVNASFAAGTIPIDRVALELSIWAAWHWARVVIGLAAFVAALLATRRG